MRYHLLVLAIAPSVAFIMWVYMKDKYEKEPLRVLVKFFILGVAISLIGIIIEGLLMNVNVWSGYSYYIYVSFIVAALTEEGLKAIALIPFLLREQNFNEKLDGIIYSIFLSLGFATVENIIYIIYENSSQVIEIGITRGIISIPAHIMFAITMGYYISKYKFSVEKLKKREYLIMSVLVPILLHGIFDFILMIRYKWAIYVFVIYIILLWKINLDKLDYYVANSRHWFMKHKNKK